MAEPFNYVDEATHEPCPTRGKLLCTITDSGHRHIAAHMVRVTADDAAAVEAGGLTEDEREALLIASHTVEPIHRTGEALFAAVERILAARRAPAPVAGRGDADVEAVLDRLATKWQRDETVSADYQDGKADAAEELRETLETLAPRLAAERRAAKAEGWDEGMQTGTSRAMRRMSDEPTLPLASAADNPYADQPAEGGDDRG